MVLEATSQCKVCGKGFLYRKNKQSCSNACKQQAYLSNKTGIPLPVITSKEIPAYDFSLSEYKAYLDKVDNGMSLISYCFFRRNLKGHPNLEQVIFFFEGIFCSDYWDYFYTIKETDTYLNFNEDFLNNKFTVGA